MASMDSRLTHTGWFRRYVERLGLFWPAKMIGMTLGMTLFFIAYFGILRHPHSPPRLMPVTFVDQWIGFWPAALPLYLSLWFYVSLAPALLVSRRELQNYGAFAATLAVTGLGMFFIWPTVVPVPDVDWARHHAFIFLKTVDASGNACPSLHVAFALFTAYWLAYALQQMKAGLIARFANWLWCLGILYSTMATRQHVALDVLAGAALGIVFAILSLRSTRLLEKEEYEIHAK